MSRGTGLKGTLGENTGRRGAENMQGWGGNQIVQHPSRLVIPLKQNRKKRRREYAEPHTSCPRRSD
jgi:hypothetical protein